MPSAHFNQELVQLDQPEKQSIVLRWQQDSPLTVTRVAYEHWGPDFLIRRNDMQHYFLALVLQGQGTLHTPGSSHTLSSGHILFMGPGQWHELSVDASPLILRIVTFKGKGKRLPPIAAKTIGPPTQVFFTSERQSVSQLMETMLHLGLRQSPQDQQIIQPMLTTLLTLLSESRYSTEQASSGAFDTYLQIRDWINAHALEVSTAAEIADRCSISPEHMCRVFRRFDVNSPYQHLMQRRMTHAADLLLSTESSVQSIAYSLNYDDPFTFSRAFKKMMGLSPQAYRERSASIY